MTGAAVLLLGLLLILAGLASGRIPGGATFASSGIAVGSHDEAGGWASPLAMARRARNPVRAFLLSPIHPATWYANAAIAFGFVASIVAFSIVVSFFSAGLTTLLAGIGIAFVALGIEAARVAARVERRRALIADPRPLVSHPYRPMRGNIFDLLRSEFADESRWRDVLYVIVNLPLAILESVVVFGIWASALALATMPVWYDAVAGASLPSWLEWLAGHEPAIASARFLAGVVLLPVAASVSQLVIALHRAVVAGLLCTSESGELRRQVETLRESRSAVLEVEASEIRRIERDLHDGAQQRLVMLTIDLGLASERIDADPQAAKRLVLEGQEQARQALAELRNLVRGIAPAILLDRGLVPAVESIASRGPVPTVVKSELPAGQRLPDAVERAAYFVIAEALANVSKHSAAPHCEVRCRLEGDRLVVEVRDDGVGGAKAGPVGGLAGLAGRVEAVDGTFTLESPAGGPTLVRAEIPVPVVTAIPGWRSAP